jgi:hypothetical protein
LTLVLFDMVINFLFLHLVGRKDMRRVMKMLRVKICDAFSNSTFMQATIRTATVISFLLTIE